MKGGGGGEGVTPHGEMSDQTNFEVGWTGAKTYGCRQDTEGPAVAAVNRPLADESSESPIFLRGGESLPWREECPNKPEGES